MFIGRSLFTRAFSFVVVIIALQSALLASARADLRSGSAAIATNGILDDEVRLVIGQPAAIEVPCIDGPELGVTPSFVFVIEPGVGIAAIGTDRSREDVGLLGPDGFRDSTLAVSMMPNADAIGPFCPEFCDVHGNYSPLRGPFNTGQLIAIYLPDSDGVLYPTAAFPNAVDDSVLYVGMDIANGDYRVLTEGTVSRGMDVPILDEAEGAPGTGTRRNNGLPNADMGLSDDTIMVPFDVDGNGHVNTLTRFNIPGRNFVPRTGFTDDPSARLEVYLLEIYQCEANFNNSCTGSVPLGQLRQAPLEDINLYENAFAPNTLTVEVIPSFLNAPLVNTFPQKGSLLVDADARGLDGVSNDDVEFIIHSIDSWVDGRFPDTDYSVDRLRLATLGIQTLSDSTSDRSGEDVVQLSLPLPIPGLEITKSMRCEGETAWSEREEALPGSVVEYRLDVENTGNVPLDVSLTDVLASACPELAATPVTRAIVDGGNGVANSAASGDDIQIVALNHPVAPGGVVILPGPNGAINSVTGGDDAVRSTSMRVTLLDQGTTATSITVANAAANGFDPTFFGQQNDAFLRNLGAPVHLGTLGPADGCSEQLGDKVIIEFRAYVSNPDGLCDACPPGQRKIINSIRGTGAWQFDVDSNTTGDEISGTVRDDFARWDIASNGIDTVRERAAGADDNVTTAGVLCRDVDLDKQVRLLPNGTFGDRVNIPSATAFPATIEYAYVSSNGGEVSEIFTLSDAQLCQDITAAAGVDFVANACDICDTNALPPVETFTILPGGLHQETCQVRFATLDDLRDFLVLDDARPVCNAGPGDIDCYANCANIAADATALNGICGIPATLTDADDATICNNPCNVDVVKEVRCLPNCTTAGLGPDVGWLPEDSVLDLRASACVQYRIRATNVTADAVPLCELLFDDIQSCPQNFATGPTNVHVVSTSNGLADDLTCAPPFATAFNWTGAPVRCVLVEPALPNRAPLQPNDTLTVLFQARLKDQAAIDETCDPQNRIDLSGAAQEDCAVSDPPAYSCFDASTVALDIGSCGLDVTKDVTCDEPRLAGVAPNPAAHWEPLLEQALLGAELAFRIRIENTGDTPLTALDIDDQLDCLTWFVADSIVADIAGADAESCLCTDGQCQTLAEMNGHKDLNAAGCGPGPIQPGEALTITFKVRVPASFSSIGTAVDCSNNVDIQGYTDACQSSVSPCPRDVDFAQIDVLVPGIECEKQVCADVNRDGDCDDPGDFAFSDNLALPCDIGFPFNLLYRIITRNTGEIALVNVDVCDPQLVADAVAAGLTVGPCDLCNDPVPCDGAGDSCKRFPTLAPAASVATLCTLQVPNRASWENFAGRDEDAAEDCYVNTVGVAAAVDTTGLCDRGAVVTRDSSCDARVCLSPPCEITVEKVVRCLDGCLDAGPFDVGTDALEATPGATVEFEFVVGNAGDTPICALTMDDLATGPFTLCPAPAFLLDCEVTPAQGAPIACNNEPAGNMTGAPFTFSMQQACGRLLNPGDELVCRFAGTISSAATSADVIRNDIAVSCAPNDGGGCIATPPVFCGNTDSDDAEVDVQRCDLTVTKDVTCDDPLAGTATWSPDFETTLPGASLGFRVQLCNTGDVNLTAIDVDDVLTCETWFVPNSVSAHIAGRPAVGCVCPSGGCDSVDDLNGLKDLTAAGCPGPIAPGECLEITFEVEVPADFDSTGTALDCENTILIQSHTDVCQPDSPNPCPSEVDTAGINVEVPSVNCDKSVCFDGNNDGTCEGSPTSTLGLPCETAFPFSLIYRVSTTNTGETTLVNVDLCDPAFVADAKAAGFQFEACELCDDAACSTVGDGCKTIASIPSGGNAAAQCRVRVPSRAAWEVFAAADADVDPNADPDCYINSSGASGDADSAGLCSRDADTSVDSGCVAEVCLARPCGLTVDKGFRCVDNCAARNGDADFTDDLVVTPGAVVEFRIDCANTGELGRDPSICALDFTDTLSGPFIPNASDFCHVTVVLSDSSTRNCSVPANWLAGGSAELLLDNACGGPLPVGAHLDVRCCGTIAEGASTVDIVTNGVHVEGAPLCPAGAPDYCCEDDDSSRVRVDTCGFSLVKEVGCGDPRVAGFIGSNGVTETLPGGEVGFRVKLCNTGETPLDRINLDDQLGCGSWFQLDSVVADENGVDCERCLCPDGACETLAEMNGNKDLIAPTCPTGALAPGECMTITYKVTAPPSFATPNTPIDCSDTIGVNVHTSVCGNPLGDPCGTAVSTASIDVRAADFACHKQITADWAPAGTIDAGPSDIVVVPEQSDFPLTLVYELQITNTGETPLVNAQLCDPELVKDAVEAGVTVSSCGLCTTPPCDGTDDACTTLPSVAVGATATVRCTLTFPTEQAFELFADKDVSTEDSAYINNMTADADASTAGLCGAPPPLAPTQCQARVSRTSSTGECYPTTKASFTIWNQNEAKFTGTDRCIVFWDQQPLSLYASGSVPNHFLVGNLQTNKGKAMIEGLASQNCNQPGFDNSVAAPLVGVAHKELSFNASVRALAGTPLVGVGTEDGSLAYTVKGFSPELRSPSAAAQPAADGPAAVDGEGGTRGVNDADGLPNFLACLSGPNHAPAGGGQLTIEQCLTLYDRDHDGDVDLRDYSRGSTGSNLVTRERANISQLGSLVVFPKVELRWDAAGNLLQDTFISLNNFANQDVLVQMYFVNGDKPLAANSETGERAHAGCNSVDVQIDLTHQEPTYWSARTGLPKGVSPFTILDSGNPPGRPALDGSGERYLRGYVVAWAVKPVLVDGRVEYHEISWNYLSGAATLVNYAITEAWEYEAWPFQSISTALGEPPDTRPGSLRLNGIEYQAAPAFLLFDFYAAGSSPFSRPGYQVITQTDLTLLPMIVDLRER
jgi:uncharacterized repeat protein (TIGR01451 family)